MTAVGGTFLAALTFVQFTAGFIVRSETEPECPDIHCFNHGVLDADTCTCACDSKHTGFFCETGYVNLTLPTSRPVQRWKMPKPDSVQNTADPHILGPYHLHALQLNFCTRLDPALGESQNDLDHGDDNVWPEGTYCVFKSGDSCMEGFSENSVTIAGYHVTWSDTDGVLPNITLDDESSRLTLSYCCRGDGENDTILDLPYEFPFLLLKKNGSSCNPVYDMAVNEERFDLVDDLDLFQFEGQDSVFTEVEEHQRLGLCYYGTTAVRECFYVGDWGFSYLGGVNTTWEGLPCLNWYDVDESWKPGRDYVGDDFTQNHCRSVTLNLFGPVCFVNNTAGEVERQLCNVAFCEEDMDIEEVGTFKPVYAVDHLGEKEPENAVDGNVVGFPFQAQRPKRKPWIQVDLEEAFLVYGVRVRRRYTWFPVNFRFAAIHVSLKRWDFVNYGALQCEERRNPRKAWYFQFTCYRPIPGQFVTIRNFDDPDPESTWGSYFFLEISEIFVLVKRTVCMRRLGLLSGEVRDFQLSGSGDKDDNMFERGRLLLPGSGWCVDRLEDPYFMVDLIVPTVVSGLEIQGWLDGQNVFSVDEFTLEFAVKEETFRPYLDPAGHTKLFRVDKNLSPSMIKRIMLMKTVVTRYMKINIIKYSGHPCLKMELIGCPKRASRDLVCGHGTMFFGFEGVSRVAFWMNSDKTIAANLSSCTQSCSENADCISAFYKPWACSIFMSTRYNPHYNHWVVRRLSEIDNTLTKLCIKDVKDARTCGGIITQPTELESPSYPFYYGQLVQCRWEIRFTRRAYIRVQIKDVNLALEDSLTNLRQNGVFDISLGRCVDELTIDDLSITSANAAMYKGAVIVTRTASAAITLTSCARYSMADAKGFLLDISYSDYPGCRSNDVNCLTTCLLPAAIINSPAYPAGLKPSMSCRWRIRGELGQVVVLSFKVIDIRSPSRTCETSYVSVIDESLFRVKTKIDSYCSYNFPINNIRSSWQFMDIQLVVGDEVTGNGFMAEYALVDYVQQTENTSSVDDQGCDDWQEYDSHCYEIFDDDEDLTWISAGLTWLSAESSCQEYGGHLVSLASPQEANFIHTLLTKKLFNSTIVDPTFYIGLRKVGSGERYVDYEWSDGSPLTYTAWFRNETSGQSQPDGLENERCTQLSMYSIHSLKNWHDVACAYDKTHMFICERPKAGYEVNNVSTEFFYGPPVDQNNTLLQQLFFCKSKERIQSVYICDGHPDCIDGSDEMDCSLDITGFIQSGFICDNGQRVSAAAYCDFRKDCGDGSDESECVLADCLPWEWTCRSGQCISSDYRCDVKKDCFDGSDEEDCDMCQPSSFQCYDQRCVASSRVCDTYNDCSGRFNEDEGQGCAQPSQQSCVEWYAIGRRENGSYLINLGIEDADAFEVECRFIQKEDNTMLVETILHHEFEAPMSWITGHIYVKPSYPASSRQLEALKIGTHCKQYLSVECSYTNNAFYWIGNDFDTLYNSNVWDYCECPYVGNCQDRCNCSKFTNEDWFGYGHDIFLKDSGYIRTPELIPVYWLVSEELGTSFSPEYRTTLGPFVCEEVIVGSGLSDTMVCDNNKLADEDTRCILDFDEYGETRGCRDLSHLETCGNNSCPEFHARCHDGHCLPFYLVCDGVRHCSSGEDEQNCDMNLACVDGLRCRESSICVSIINVCDNVKHCPLGDDERFCNLNCPINCFCNDAAMVCSVEFYVLALETHSLHFIRSIRTLLIDNEISVDYVFNASAFVNLPYLIKLNLTRTRVKQLHPYQFENNKNLITLDISENLISVLYASTFEGLGKLTKLLLTGNPLHEIQPFSFKGLDRLPFLDLTGFSIADLTRGMFNGLSMLQRLNLSSSHLVTVESNTFADLPELKTLDVRNNEIKDFDKGIFDGLKGLKYLYTSDFTLCCLRPESVREENCLPSKDEFSSCDDLMRNQVLRAFLWIIGGLALIGNIAVLIYRFIVDRQGLGKTYGVFVSNLSVADFLMGVYLVILAIADTVFRGSYVWNDHHWRNGAACKLAGVLSTLGSEGSVIFLCLITLDRILVVKFPFGNVRISHKACICMCCCAWTLVLMLALVPLLTGDYFQGSFYSRSAVCLPLPLTRDRPAGWEYSIGVFIVFNLLAFIMIALAQVVIYREIYISRGKIASKGRRHDMTIARNLFLVAITDFLCWFPVGVMGMMALNGQVISGEVYSWIAVFVLPINSALNPFIYTIGASVSKARTNRRSTIKRSSTKAGSSGNITEVFSNRSFHFGRRSVPDKESLVDLTLKRAVTPKETLIVALRLAKCMHTLHGVDLVHGKLAADKVYMKDTRKHFGSLHSEDTDRQSQSNFVSSTLANADMVYVVNEDTGRQTSDSAEDNAIVDSSKSKHETSNGTKTSTSCMQSVRNSYRKRGFSANATSIIMSSWRGTTKREYQVYISRWLLYCDRQKIDSISVSVKDVIEFLTSEFERGLSYSAINTARAALSSLGITLGAFTAGTHPTVVRFLRGVFNRRPPEPKYSHTWDVDKVLWYMKKLSPVKHLSLKDLTLKLTMLMVLTNAARVQTVHLLSVHNIQKLSSEFVLQFRSLLKQSRPGFECSSFSLKAYPPDRRLCVYTVLKEYLKRTKTLRGKNEDALLISYVKPYRPVTRDTIARWVKTLMVRAGIKQTFGAHSVRSAVVSKAHLKGVPLKDILTRAGWSSQSTFAKFYNKKVVKHDMFDHQVLQC